MPLSREKLALVQVARRQLSLTEDDYRAILWKVAGVRSSTQLDQARFNALMDHFAALGFKSTSPRKPLAPRAGMASPEQVQLVRHLWHEFTGGQGDDRSLSRWIEGKFKVSSIRFVDAATVPRVIAALRKMVGKRRSAGPPQAT